MSQIRQRRQIMLPKIRQRRHRLLDKTPQRPSIIFHQIRLIILAKKNARGAKDFCSEAARGAKELCPKSARCAGDLLPRFAMGARMRASMFLLYTCVSGGAPRRNWRILAEFVWPVWRVAGAMFSDVCDYLCFPTILGFHTHSLP